METWRTVVLKTGHEEWTVRARPAPEPPPVRALLEFTATDSDNRYLDVAWDDVAVEEDGVPQKVESFQEAVAPVSIILTLDQSGSMRRRPMRSGRRPTVSWRSCDRPAASPCHSSLTRRR
jgi:hypothetical protein